MRNSKKGATGASNGKLDKNLVNIHIGEYYASREPAVIYTVLGSCVAVCLHDPTTRIGGMNHIFLPGRADIESNTAPTRFAVNAMELLINSMMSKGGDRYRLVAKVFGGGHVISAIPAENGIGNKIAAFVIDFLKKERIRLLSYDLGGNQGRKVYFHTDNGDVFLKRIPSRLNRSLVNREQKKVRSIKNTVDKAGEITLFNDDN